MHRGTLMVLKRILMTALGALGMGALAAGSAFAQSAGDGNIPAPDIFDDQITCSMNVPPKPPTPTVVPKGQKDESARRFDRHEGDMRLLNADGMGVDGVDDLGYVIPPMGGNCGAGVGTDLTPFNAATVGMAGNGARMMGDDGYVPPSTDYNRGEGDIATLTWPMGYSKLLGKSS